MQDPLVASDYQPAIHAAVRVVLFATGGKHGTLVLQAAQVLSVPAKSDARTASGKAACNEWRQGGGGQPVSIRI
jgi:hypothetical protein